MTMISDSDPEPAKSSKDIKTKVLESSSDDSDLPAKSVSSDSSFGTPKKRKSRRKRNAESKLGKNVKKGENKQKVKTAEDEIESLTNIKSLRRKKVKHSSDSSSDVEIKPTPSKSKREVKKKEKEKTLMDLLGELSDSSEPEHSDTENKNPDLFKSYWVNQEKLLKNLVLGTSSSEDDVAEEKVSDKEIVPKKETVKKDDECDSKSGKRKRELSVGVSDSSANDGIGDKKKKVLSDSDSDRSSNLQSKGKKKKIVSDLDSDHSSIFEKKEKKKKVVSDSDSDQSVSKISDGSDSETKKQKKKRKRKSVSSGSDVQKGKNWKRIAKDSNSESDSDVAVVSQTTNSPAKGRRNIKQLMKKVGILVKEI